VDIDREQLMPVFLGEAEEHLAAMEQLVLALDQARAPGEIDDAIAALFRLAHTLKGNAEALGVEAVARCAHAVEEVLEAIRGGSVVATTPLVTTLLGAHDALHAMIAAAARGESPDLAPHDDVLRALGEAARGTATTPSATRRVPAPEQGFSRAVEPRVRKSLRVDLATLDRIVTHTGELGIVLARLHEALQPYEDAQDALLDVERIFEDLREQAMRLRLVRIGPMFHQQLRGVRDLAAAHGKLARLMVEGDEVEVDAAVLDGLRDPVTHMVRNAIDHALERPAERQAVGKDPVGTVTLRARYEAGWVVVQVCDDGAGFDRARILERARELGLAGAGAALGDEEIERLVLTAGFSTARAVTELSGRGVGMDVVARNVAALKGSVSVRSTEGRGSVVTLRVPLTLAILDGFAVRAAAETFVIPMDAVRECIANAASGEGGVISVRGQPVPCLKLETILGLAEASSAGPSRRATSLVVVEHEGARAALVVDDLVGEMHAVVKPLGAELRAAQRIAGSTILGDGRVALILDVPAVFREAASGVTQ